MKKRTMILLLVIVLTKLSFSQAHILVFHRFLDERYPSTSISEEKLVSVFDYLKDNNYNITTLNDLITMIENEKPIPEKTIVFTIDDGYKSFYENGLKLFQKHNIPFTNFINTEAINLGYGDYMNWDQVREVAKYGEIGSHSYAHDHMANMKLEDAINDIKRSVNDLEKNLNMNIEYFSYPYGEYNEKLEEATKNMGFRATFIQTLGAVSNESRLYRLHRIAITDNSNLDILLRHKYLNANWAHTKNMLEGNVLKKIKVEVPNNINRGEMYISGQGSWERVSLNNGVLEKDVNITLPKGRTRIFFKTYNHEITSKMLIVK